MSKRFQTQKKWAILLEQFHASNQSARKWCQQKNISYPSLLHWKNKLKAETNFIELKQEELIELSWKGIKITFARLENLKDLKCLLETLC